MAVEQLPLPMEADAGPEVAPEEREGPPKPSASEGEASSDEETPEEAPGEPTVPLVGRGAAIARRLPPLPSQPAGLRPPSPRCCPTPCNGCPPPAGPSS